MDVPAGIKGALPESRLRHNKMLRGSSVAQSGWPITTRSRVRAPLPQLRAHSSANRAAGFDPAGREFKSLWARHLIFRVRLAVGRLALTQVTGVRVPTSELRGPCAAPDRRGA